MAADQDTAGSNTIPKLTEDQPPPAYPCNDKPPDYHDVCPRKSVSNSPPPVAIDIANMPTIHFPQPGIVHINFPHTSTTTVITSSDVHGIDIATITTTTTSRNPDENVVDTQPNNATMQDSNHSEDDENNRTDCRNISWKILIVLSIIAAIIVMPIGLHACFASIKGYNSTDPDERIFFARMAICMCTFSYLAVTVVVIVVPAVLA